MPNIVLVLLLADDDGIDDAEAPPPDDEEAAKEFQKLQVAYDVLRVAEERREWRG